MITTGDKQNQKAGDNSQQLQATNMTVIVGIDEKRAREICEEMTQQLRKDYSAEALKIAISRVSEFENKLMPKMETIDGALEAFGDPSFQLLLVEAQKTAASSERPEDYDLLAELLIHRFQKGENRIARAGISRAVKIVDEISDEALLGLTVFHSALQFGPTQGGVREGLEVLNNLFGEIIYDKLPVGNDWIDHLEILDAVRINNFGNLKKMHEYYPTGLNGYVDVGIKKNSDDHLKAIDILKSQSLGTEILVEHELNNGFIRLKLFDESSVDTLQILQRDYFGNKVIPLSDIQTDAMKSIYNLYVKDESIKQQNVNQLMIEWNKFPHLKTVREWWDSIALSFQITSVGKVLAHSNAQRCDSRLPPLD